MRRRDWITLTSLCVVTAGVLALTLHSREAGVSGDELEPIAESPRPPVTAERFHPVLRGFPPAETPPPSADDRAALVEERNGRAREHRDAVARYEAGLGSIGDVEVAEMRLLDARHRVGEIDGPTWHRARAALLVRAVERAKLLVEAGFVSASDEAALRLSLELERMLAGDTNTYAATRDGVLAEAKDRHRALVEAGLATSTALQEEFDRLALRFPTADVARSRDR